MRRMTYGGNERNIAEHANSKGWLREATYRTDTSPKKSMTIFISILFEKHFLNYLYKAENIWHENIWH